MLKKLVTITIILLSTFNVLYGNAAFTEIRQSKQCMITGASGQMGGGMSSYLREQYIQAIFLYLEENYLTPDQHLQINFGLYSKFYSNDTIKGKLPYSLGYDYTVFNIYSSDGNRINKQKAFKTIILNVSTDSINVRDCLKLLLYGLEHKEEIETEQRGVIVKHIFGGSDSIKTVPQKAIDDILKTDNPFLNELLKHKVYRQSFPIYPKSYGKLDIYTKNDSFFLYETENIKPSYYNLKNYLRKGFITDTLNTSLFSFSEIIDFCSDKNDNYIFSTGNRNFYHIRVHDKKVSGPYMLPSLNTKIDKHSSMCDSFISRGDSAILTIQTDYDHSSYSIIFKPNTGEIRIDSSSFCQSIKEIVQQEKQERDRKLLIIKEAETIKQHKYYALILICFVVALNMFLAFNKKL